MPKQRHRWSVTFSSRSIPMIFFSFSKDPRVLDQMLPFMTHMYGNPHSRTHAFGWESERAVEEAREVNSIHLSCIKFVHCVLQKIARLINADPKEIVFTSGATESNNIAVKGVGRFYKEKKKHLITTQTVRLSSREIDVQCESLVRSRNTNVSLTP